MADPTDPIVAPTTTTPSTSSSTTTTAPSLMDSATNLASSNAIVPTTNTFDESKGVAGRVDSITNTDSPLMQTAATKAAQASNARGLNSSTLGVQAGQQAVIETATPIANADANLYQGQQLANQQAQNAASTANSTNKINAGLQGMSLDNSNTQQSSSLMESARQFNTTASMQQQQIDAQIAQFAQNLGLTAQELQLKKDTLSSSDQQFLANLELQKSQLAQQQAQFSTSQQQAQAQFDASLAQKTQQFNLTQQQSSALASLDANTKVQLANIEAANKASIQGDQNISGAWGTMMQSIGNIQNNAQLDNATKTTLIQQTLDQFQAYASYYSSVSGVDVSSLLQFSTAGSTPQLPTGTNSNIPTEPAPGNGLGLG